MTYLNLDPVDPLLQADETSPFFQVLARANQITNQTDLNELLDEMLNLILQISGASAGTLYLVDRHIGDGLIFKSAVGDEQMRTILEQCVVSQLRIADTAMQEREPETIRNLSSDPRWQIPTGLMKNDDWNMICLPILLRGDSIGVVQVFNFSHSPLPMMQFLGNHMASEIEKSSLINASTHRSERFEALVDIIGEFTSTLDPDQVLNRIVQHACKLLGAESASIFLLDKESGDAILHLASNIDQDENIRVPAGKGIIGHVIESGETVVISDITQDRRHYKGVDIDVGITTRSLIAVPFFSSEIILGGERGVAKEKIIGGIEAINKIEGVFNDSDAELLGILANQAATVLHIAQLYTNSDELFLDTIQALVAAIDLKDPYTEWHSHRVSEFSVAIAEDLGLSSEEIRHIRIGALLHDIGKIGVPDHILGKPDTLTNKEFAEIKKHPSLGAKIILNVNSLRSEVPALAQHHERLDGMGYPAGLAGDEIELIARIVAVADVFDALTSDRPYRRAMDIDIAFKTLRYEAGDHLDSIVVESLIRAFNQGKIHYQKRKSTSK